VHCGSEITLAWQFAVRAHRPITRKEDPIEHCSLQCRKALTAKTPKAKAAAKAAAARMKAKKLLKSKKRKQ
jgi:hypothetical protein